MSEDNILLRWLWPLLASLAGAVTALSFRPYDLWSRQMLPRATSADRGDKADRHTELALKEPSDPKVLGFCTGSDGLHPTTAGYLDFVGYLIWALASELPRLSA